MVLVVVGGLGGMVVVLVELAASSSPWSVFCFE